MGFDADTKPQCVGDTEDAFIWEDFERQCQDIGKVASLNCWTDDD